VDELELINTIKTAPGSAAAEYAREQLVEAHRSRVRGVARKFRIRRDAIDDLEAAGWRGFFEALPNYSPARGADLWTYAKHEVSGRVRDEAAQLGNVGWTIPEHVRNELVKKRRALAHGLTRAVQSPS